MKAMNENTDKIVTTNKSCFRGDIKIFSHEEKEAIKKARKITGTDRPTFYHDAVVDYANRTNAGENNG